MPARPLPPRASDEETLPLALSCADCDGTLQPLQCGKAVVDRCRRCAGIWFDEGELRFFRDGLERQALATLTMATPAGVAVRPTHSPCPRCHCRLARGEFAYGTGVRVARCSGCEGVWLPGTEVARFVAHVRSARENRAETREIVEAVAEGTQAQLERHHPLQHSSLRFWFRHPFATAGSLFWLPVTAEAHGDNPPRATVLLLLALFVAFLTVPSDVATSLALVPASLSTPGPWGTLLGASFVHAGWLHLLGNALFLGVFGRAVENTLGFWRFLTLYFLADLAASLAYVAAVGLASTRGCVGSSGAVSGVLGAYLVLHPRGRVTTVSLGSTVRVSAWLYLGLWFLLQCWGAATAGPDDNVAWSAHFGGFLAGVLLGWRCRRASA